MTSETSSTRVLVIDDEPAICRVVALTLKRHGFEVESVSDAQAITSMLNEERPFDVILLDRTMGTIKGRDLLPGIRIAAPDAKVLYFTGELVDEQEAKMVDGVVQKPVKSMDLTATLREVLMDR